MTRAYGRRRAMTFPDDNNGVEFADSGDEPAVVDDSSTDDGTPRETEVPDGQEQKFESRAFFNSQDGWVGRDGGPYLDQVERVNAEQRRALLEGREVRSTEALLNEPLPAATGTDLRIAALVPDNRLTSNPSMRGVPGLEQSITDETFRNNNGLADPIATLDVDVAASTSGVVAGRTDLSRTGDTDGERA